MITSPASISYHMMQLASDQADSAYADYFLSHSTNIHYNKYSIKHKKKQALVAVVVLVVPVATGITTATYYHSFFYYYHPSCPASISYQLSISIHSAQ